MRDDYEFSVDWFTPHWQNWITLTEGQKISKILEIGSFEGRSTCTMIEHFSKAGPLEIFCIDDWSGGFEHGAFDMNAVEQRFNRNINRAITATPHKVVVRKNKGKSVDVMAGLLVDGHRDSFNLIFVDGSHEAADVLTDLILSYRLCAKNGFIICDDYLWSEEPHGREDLSNMPRQAVDAFAAIFCRKVHQVGGLPIYQVYLRKTA